MKRIITSLLICLVCMSCAGRQPGSQTNRAAAPSNAGDSHATHNSTSHADHSMMTSSPGAASAPFELQFLDSMIVHHRGAVEMANLAGSRAEHKELKELAADIINDQEREIAKMSQWRDRWFEGKSEAINMEFPGMSRGMGGMDMRRLGSLKGNEFDLEFLRQMIPHHEGAVEMAGAIKGSDSYAELKELAENIIVAQKAEIRQMQEWLKIWSQR